MGAACLYAVSPVSGDTPVKTERTVIAPEDIERFRASQVTVDRALKGDGRPFTAAVGNAPAAQWVDKPDNWFWTIMPSTTIQRVVTVGNDSFRSPKLGCPVHGSKIYEINAYYPWVVDCEKAPYKLTCPIGGETYPSNDFATGDLTSGEFPDDGTGWVKNGTRYHFIGLYAHYAYNTVIQPAIKSFGHAYLITGDRRYAHKAAVCLLKEAYEYPNSTDRKQRTYLPGYAQGSGMITDVVWSSGALVASATCYDAIAMALEGDDELVRFAQARIPEIESVDDVRVYIEDHLFRPGIQAIIDRRIQPNTGWAQQAMATLALMMNDFGDKHPNSVDALDWLYDGAGRMRTLGNQFYKDGSSYESTGYNNARAGFVSAAETIERLRALAPDIVSTQRYPNMRQNEKLLRFLDTYRPAVEALGGAYTICIGDAGSPVISPTPRVSSRERSSEFLDGYGLAALRSGSGASQRDLTLFYGGLRGHAHYDPLMLGLFGYGRDLLPNIGYPQSWNFASAWEWSLFTHNTVVVDRDEKPCSTVIGSLTLWETGKGCQVMEAEKRPYRKNEPRGEQGPDVSDYRRLSALIDVDAERWYVIDVFRVTGGSDHMQSWHSGAPVASVEVSGAALVSQDGGTLAGPDVEYGARYKDTQGRERWDPYCFLRDVSRGPMDGVTTVDIGYKTEDRLTVRLAFVPTDETELITARGGAPIAPDKDPLTWTVPHRSGAEGLQSQFVTVIEATTSGPVVSGVRRLPAEPVGAAHYAPLALEILVPGGRDIVLLNGTSEGALRGDGFGLTGRFGLIRLRDGQRPELFLAGGTEVRWREQQVTRAAPPSGRIVEVDRATGSVVVQMHVAQPALLAGRRVVIDNHGERLCSYTVKSAVPTGAGRLRIELDSTGVLGEGLATGFEDGVVINGQEINMPFAGLCRIDQRLDTSDCFHFGGHLETGKPGVDLKVRGVMGFPYQAWGLLHEGGINHVHLCEPIPAERLRELIGQGTAWTIYEYGVGDTLRVDPAP
jgi:hypothetical protein